jgi:hypothetical protein
MACAPWLVISIHSDLITVCLLSCVNPRQYGLTQVLAIWTQLLAICSFLPSPHQDRWHSFSCANSIIMMLLSPILKRVRITGAVTKIKALWLWGMGKFRTSEGQVTVQGFDAVAAPQEVRKRIGILIIRWYRRAIGIRPHRIWCNANGYFQTDHINQNKRSSVHPL